MQIYGLNGTGQVADIPGAVAGGQNYKLQKDAIDEQKKLENTTWLAGAAKYGLDNWGQPGILEQLVEEGKRRGIIDPQTQPQGITKEGLIKIYQGARTALGGVDPMQKEDNRTAEQKNFEYAQQNPRFDQWRNKQPDTKAPSNVQEYEYYQSLPDDESRAEYLRVKRGADKPSSALEKRLYESNDAAFDARSKANRYEKLATELIQQDPKSGLPAKWTEVYKGITGQEDAVTLLRKDWNQLRVGAAVQNLPPGVASDKDIELVMSAFLPEFAQPETVASFMRGLAKLENLRAEFREFESEYLSQNRSAIGLNKAWRAHLEGLGDTGNGGGPEGPNVEQELRDAREAIAADVDPEWVKDQLRQKGIDPGYL